MKLILIFTLRESLAQYKNSFFAGWAEDVAAYINVVWLVVTLDNLGHGVSSEDTAAWSGNNFGRSGFLEFEHAHL